MLCLIARRTVDRRYEPYLRLKIHRPWLRTSTKLSPQLRRVERRLKTSTHNMSFAKAVLYEKADMHDEFAAEMRTIVQESDGEPDKTEQKMLSNAYKNVVGKMRASWRAVVAIEEKLGQDDPRKNLTAKYLAHIVQELTTKCKELLALLEDDLIPKLTKPEAKVFFLKMKGDHLRYLVEVANEEEDENLTELKSKSKAAYKESERLAEEHLSPTHPFRLGLALNFSVFHYEVENSQESAYEMAKKAFDNAIPLLDQLNEDEADDVTTIMQLLRDNLTFWSEEI
ncbi:14-3-3-like protein isoform X2 [Dendronephthya gigantea]|uniref:14-3-3-like protein isoform X2 n=1 Tax=Dendronephthya gigantea TaxID=151771 RepID=UPI00106B00D3|nr:14-3-3-like protein isoform X2 [Dendronephthya gigantea]